MKDYYDILGVKKDSSQDDIKKAYRKLAKEYHPDKNNGDKQLEEKFKEVSEAYENIGNEESRKKYDNKQNHTDFSNFSEYFGGGININDFLNFGKQQRKQKPKGGNLRCTLNVTLEDVFNGFEKVIKIQRQNSCKTCSGTGAKDSNDNVKCPLCDGSGKTSKTVSNGFFQSVQWSVCPLCNGDKIVPKHNCSDCSGTGVIRESNDINISIEKGVDETNFILPNEGNSIKNGIKGDLHIVLNYIIHEKFLRRNSNVEYNLHIGILDSLLGSEIVVPTLHGDVSLTLEKSIQNGKRLKLTGKGLPRYGTNFYGDQYINVVVDMPQKLSPTDMSIIEQLKDNTKFLYGIV